MTILNGSKWTKPSSIFLYHLGRFEQMLQWSSTSKKNQVLYGAGLGFAF
jgi:hypothetical protein